MRIVKFLCTIGGSSRASYTESKSVSMAGWALVAAEHRLRFEVLVSDWEDKFNVVVIDKSHESIVFVDGEYSFTDKVDESSLVSDVVHRGIDGDDDFAQLLAFIIKSTLDLEITNSALFGVWAEDVVVFVDEAIELVLEVLDAGTTVSDLELEVGREHRDNFVTFWGSTRWSPDTTLVTGVLGRGLIVETEANFAHSVAHGSLAPGDLVVA